MGRTRFRKFSAILTSIAVRNSKIPGSKMEQAHERDLINNANKAVHSAKDPLDKLRQHCLARGVKGIVSLKDLSHLRRWPLTNAGFGRTSRGAQGLRGRDVGRRNAAIIRDDRQRRLRQNRLWWIPSATSAPYVADQKRSHLESFQEVWHFGRRSP